MAWVFLEGLDRTGKSTVAELYRNKGFEVVHMSAPDKKYRQPGYIGQSYFEDIVELYMKYDGRDILFDRSVYGELVWPKVYGREPQLSEDDFEFLREYEERNQAEYFLMYDSNVEAHWKRCVENKEPLNKQQFLAASKFFDTLATSYGFIKKQLPDFTGQRDASPSVQPNPTNVASNNVTKAETTPSSTNQAVEDNGKVGSSLLKTNEQLKLEKANAINEILSKRIIKKSSPIFDALEKDIRDFLNKKLSSLFGNDQLVQLDDNDLLILKRYCEQIKNKIGGKL